MTAITFKLHPATLILLWLGLAIALPRLDVAALAAASAATVPALLAAPGNRALRMLRRARWLLLSLLAIYAFATPGEPAISALGAFGPTLQGLRGGGLQAWRLALMLATLALLLHACPRETLLHGIYTMLRPFRRAGLDPERIAVRLWLTLRYAEQQPERDMRAWWRELFVMAPSEDEVPSRVRLEGAAFARTDAAVLAAALLLACALWLAFTLW